VRLDVRENGNEFLAGLIDLCGQMAFQLMNSGGMGAVGFRANQVHDRFRLRQVKTTVGGRPAW